MTIPTAFLIAFLTGHGYGPAQREAVLWNAERESGLRPGIVSKSGHAGLFQYSGSRRQALVEYARARGRHWSDALMQLEFMDREIRRMAFARRFFAATSATAARALFCVHYERAARC